MAEEEARLEQLIKTTWEKRGIYPALNKVVNHFIDNAKRSNELAVAINVIVSPKNDLLDLLTGIVDENIPEELEDFEDELQELADNRLFKKNLAGLTKLSLFNLTQFQVSSVIANTGLLKEISVNPYALFEEYMPAEDDLDIPQMQDEPIDVYKVDVGMIPDRRFVKRHRKLQNLAEDSPQRIRSVYIDHLEYNGQQGHCYDQTHNLIAGVKEHPLIYKIDKVSIDEQALIDLDSDYKSHFIEKLHITKGEGIDFYYRSLSRELSHFLCSFFLSCRLAHS